MIDDSIIRLKVVFNSKNVRDFTMIIHMYLQLFISLLSKIVIYLSMDLFLNIKTQ